MPANVRVQVECDIRDLAFADSGRRRIEWSFQSMPVLQAIRKQFIKAQPLAGIRVSACLPVTPESANFLIALKNGGADVALCAPESSPAQDDIASSLVRDHAVSVFAHSDESPEIRSQHLDAALGLKPHLLIEEGCDLLCSVYAKRNGMAEELVGAVSGTAESRLRSFLSDGALRHPVVSVQDARPRALFFNRLGVGQSAIDALVRATNILLAGLNVVVAGYGACGRGIASRAHGLGANVIVTEVDHVRALDAFMDGHRVMSMNEAAALADVVFTVTGNRHVLCRDHFARIKNGAILCNAGNPAGEIELEALSRVATSRRDVRERVEEFNLGDGRKVYLLSGGRPINSAAGEALPAAATDLDFATQALAAEYLIKHRGQMENRIHSMPEALDRTIARFKLETLNIQIDRLGPVG
jgi:adenosylhomocysteinase